MKLNPNDISWCIVILAACGPGGASIGDDEAIAEDESSSADAPDLQLRGTVDENGSVLQALFVNLPYE